LKYRFGYDDSLDVVGVHFVGGWIGSLAIGFFATAQVNAGITDENILNAGEGLFYGGGLTQLGRQFLGSLTVSLYSFAIAAVLALVIKAAKGLRVSEDAEVGGIDIANHGETGYDLTPAAGGSGGGAFAMAGISPGPTTDADRKAAVAEKVTG
jgi:Amt family ammonium transporter